MPIIDVENLSKKYPLPDDKSKSFFAVDGISLKIEKGEIFGILGPNGAGKTTTLEMLEGLVDIDGGSAYIDGIDVKANPYAVKKIIGVQLQANEYFDNTSLDELLTLFGALYERDIDVSDLLNKVDLLDKAHAKPSQLSGGQKQRVMIAMALACRPKILIADEPTTALDVTVQAQIFDLMQALRKETEAAIILITHDMGSVAEMAERVVVMYAGRKIEEGQVDDILIRPRHPYTRGLIACVPHLLETVSSERPYLQEVPGMVPPLADFGFDGCMFAPRCDLAEESCWQKKPDIIRLTDSQSVACWNLQNLEIPIDV